MIESPYESRGRATDERIWLDIRIHERSGGYDRVIAYLDPGHNH